MKCVQMPTVLDMYGYKDVEAYYTAEQPNEPVLDSLCISKGEADTYLVTNDSGMHCTLNKEVVLVVSDEVVEVVDIRMFQMQYAICDVIEATLPKRLIN